MDRPKETMQMNGVRLDDRVVPVPQSISHSAQLKLHASVGEDRVPHSALYAMPGSEDYDVWRRLRETIDAHDASMLKATRSDVTAQTATEQIGSATVHVATPADLRNSEIAYIDLHGGALLFGGGEACRESARGVADLHGVRCYGIDYRMPPDHPFPAALEDCLGVYRYAVQKYGADHVIIGGRSAGGNLALATALRAQDEGLPLPTCLILLSPEIDLTESGESFSANRTLDVNLPNPLMSANRLYANDSDLSHPYLSPLFGTITKVFPPTSSRAAPGICSSRTLFGCIGNCARLRLSRNCTSSRQCRMAGSAERRRTGKSHRRLAVSFEPMFAGCRKVQLGDADIEPIRPAEGRGITQRPGSRRSERPIFANYR